MSFYDVNNLNNGSDTGAYVNGMFVEGCKFDSNKGILDDSDPNVMSSGCPIIDFIPNTEARPEKNDFPMPLYKTNTRAGVLSTTGQNSNFVAHVDTPSKKKGEYWIMKGAAFLCTTND